MKKVLLYTIVAGSVVIYAIGCMQIAQWWYIAWKYKFM